MEEVEEEEGKAWRTGTLMGKGPFLGSDQVRRKVVWVLVDLWIQIHVFSSQNHIFASAQYHRESPVQLVLLEIWLCIRSPCPDSYLDDISRL